MTSDIIDNDQMIYSPIYKNSLSANKLRDYEDENPEAKKQVIEEEIEQ
jgi:hypothetical protein